MKPTHITVAAFAAALALMAQAQTNVYRWIDKDGKVHFSDTAPTDDAKEVSQKRMGGGGDEAAALPYATQVAARRNPVTLYSGNDCGELCARGRELLDRRGIPYAEKDAQGNPADREALRKLVGSLVVPVLVVGDNKLTGYDEAAWQSVLDNAGYLRTRLPGTPSLRTPPVPVAPPTAPASAAPPAENK